MFRADQLDVDRAMVLVIDLQDKLLPAIGGGDRIIQATRKLLDGVRVFGLPVLATEQYPKGIGPTHRIIGDAARPANWPACSRICRAPLRSHSAKWSQATSSTAITDASGRLLRGARLVRIPKSGPPQPFRLTKLFGAEGLELNGRFEGVRYRLGFGVTTRLDADLRLRWPPTWPTAVHNTFPAVPSTDRDHKRDPTQPEAPSTSNHRAFHHVLMSGDPVSVAWLRYMPGVN